LEGEMKEKLLIVTVGIIELMTIKSWLVCHNLQSMMDISSVNTKLQLEDYIHSDTNTSFFVIRFFHNKITGLFINTLDKYLKYWDIRFTSNVFSLIGVLGIFLGLWRVGQSKIKRIYKILIFVLVIVWPLPFSLNVLHISFVYKFLLFIMPYYILSLFGVWKFIKTHKKYTFTVVILLSLLSIWWFILLPREIAYFCVK
jgi:hypothetical protein